MRDLITRNLSEVSSQLLSLAGGLARNVIQFAITLMALFVLYLDGERVLAQARRLAGIFFPAAPADFVDDIGAVVRAVVFGLLGTAVAQGAIAAIGFAIFDVPSPVLLGMVTALGSFVPFGPTLVWLAAVVGLVLAGETGAAIGMTLWGALLVSTVDNVLRPLLISGPTQIPFLLVLFGVLGGLSTLGLLGLFVGPVVLSVAFALLAEFGKRPAIGARAQRSARISSGIGRSRLVRFSSARELSHGVARPLRRGARAARRFGSSAWWESKTPPKALLRTFEIDLESDPDPHADEEDSEDPAHGIPPAPVSGTIGRLADPA